MLAESSRRSKAFATDNVRQGEGGQQRALELMIAAEAQDGGIGSGPEP